MVFIWNIAHLLNILLLWLMLYWTLTALEILTATLARGQKAEKFMYLNMSADLKMLLLLDWMSKPTHESLTCWF